MQKWLIGGLVIIAAVGVAVALDVTSTAVYTDVDGGLTAGTRSDTIAIGTGKSGTYLRTQPDRTSWHFGGTINTTTADSVSYAVVKALIGGLLYNIGEDSVVLKPGTPASSGTWSGESRTIWGDYDSLVVITTWKDSVDNARLTWDKINTP